MLSNCGAREDSFEGPLDNKAIKPVNPKGTQSWIFIRRTDAEAKASVIWPPDENSQLIRMDPDSGKYSKQKEIESKMLDDITDSKDLS